MRKFWHKLKRVKKYANEFLEWSERYFSTDLAGGFLQTCRKNIYTFCRIFTSLRKEKKQFVPTSRFCAQKTVIFLFVILFNLITSEIAFFREKKKLTRILCLNPKELLSKLQLKYYTLRCFHLCLR